MNEGHVVYVGPFRFPEGGAGSRRVLFNCLAMKDRGYKVTVGSGQMVEKNMVEEFRGVDVVSLNERHAENLPKIFRHMRYLSMARNTISWLDSLSQKPKAVILYSGYSPYLLRLIYWCKAHKVKLIFDAVEWYQPEYRYKILTLYYLNIELSMRFLIAKAKNVLVISSFLDNYYRSRCNTLLIPPTIDVEDCRDNYVYDGMQSLKLIYAGEPGHKDLLHVIIRAVIDMRALGYAICLDVVGLSISELDQYCKYYNIEKPDQRFIIPHGYVAHVDALRLVSVADYSILLRPIEKFSMAGFSTKFVESLASGTPMIANLTSDLGCYMIDGKNSLVCEGYNLEPLVKVLTVACETHQRKNEYLAMRASARETACRYFDYRHFGEKLEIFIESEGS